MAIRHEKVGEFVKRYIQRVVYSLHAQCGAIDSPGGPSMAAIVSPGGLAVATKFAVDDPAGPILGGPSMA